MFHISHILLGFIPTEIVPIIKFNLFSHVGCSEEGPSEEKEVHLCLWLSLTNGFDSPMLYIIARKCCNCNIIFQETKYVTLNVYSGTKEI